MRFEDAEVNGEPSESAYVDTSDHECLREIAAWCGGVATDEGTGVALVDALGRRVLARNGDIVLRLPAGGFSVVARELLGSRRRGYCRAENIYRSDWTQRGSWR